MDGVIGIGIDQVEVRRLAGAIARHPVRFPARVFTQEEIEYCRRGARPDQRFAVRFAAKEAVMKALGTGWSGEVRFRDIEVLRGPAGPPGIRLAGGARRVARRRGVRGIHVSLSHTDAQAVAVVILTGPGEA